MNALDRVLHKKIRLGVGVLSGTSLDGIDAGLVKLSGSGERTKVNLLAFKTYPFEKAVRENMLKNFSPKTATLPELSQLNALIGTLFSNAVRRLLKQESIALEKIDFVASHGQTFWHQPEPERIGTHRVRSTFQLGDGSVIASELGVVTISDFRTAELPLGGDGAPLMPYLDFLLYRSKTTSRALLNIGGISNISVLPKGCAKQDVIFFDCGAGNLLMDKAAMRFFNKSFDKNGRIAASGTASDGIVRTLLQHKYFQLPPPKSTGRELFSDAYFESVVNRCREKKLSDADILATLTEFTVRAIYRQYQTFIEPRVNIEELIVSGGGAKNPVLMRKLRQMFYFCRVLSQDAVARGAAGEVTPHSIPAKAKEAVLFAVLGNEFLSGNSASMTTPARLGKLSLPPVTLTHIQKPH